MRTVPQHTHVWYEISHSSDGKRLMACSERRCIETKVIR